MNLRERAIAAYEAKIEREAHEAAEAEKQRRNAHVARLQALCTQILELLEPPAVEWATVDGRGEMPVMLSQRGFPDTTNPM